MSKVIESQSKRWPGKVTIADPLTLPQAEAIEAGMGLNDDPKDKEAIVSLTFLDRRQIPAILLCVEKWELQNFPETPTLENWPFSPRAASHELVAHLFGAILAVYLGELEVPNE